MKLWIVSYCWANEGGEALGVFSSKERAESYCAKIPQGNAHFPRVEEFELDEAIIDSTWSK